MLSWLIELYRDTYNPVDKQIEQDLIDSYKDIWEEIFNTMLKINGRPPSVSYVIYANIVELNIYEYDDPCTELCICTPLDNIPSECE